MIRKPNGIHEQHVPTEEMAIMTDMANNQNEPHKLDDTELNEVTGGKGEWNAAKEAEMQWKYERAQKGGERGGFETWYRSTYGMGSGNLRRALDELEARKLWIADGSREDQTYYYG